MDRLLSMGPSQSAESSRPSRQKRVGEILRQDTRDRLLQAAGEEFPVHGYAGTTEDAARRFAGLPPRERLAELAALVTQVAERAATGWSLYRYASAVDPEIAADWNELQLLRHRLIARVLGDIPVSALTEGLTMKSAVDTAWAIASPESYDLLGRRLGYQLEEFHDWMRQNLIAAILAP